MRPIVWLSYRLAFAPKHLTWGRFVCRFLPHCWETHPWLTTRYCKRCFVREDGVPTRIER
jgi:hypothetical protein